jgi:hypothetical protein
METAASFEVRNAPSSYPTEARDEIPWAYSARAETLDASKSSLHYLSKRTNCCAAAKSPFVPNTVISAPTPPRPESRDPR